MAKSENFSFSYQGKKIKVTVEFNEHLQIPWRASMLCPYGCGVPIVGWTEKTAKKAYLDIKRRIERHWDIMHKVVKNNGI